MTDNEQLITNNQPLTIKNCAACGKAFECNAADIMNCQCYAVKIPEDVAPLIKAQYADCLCAQCLQEIIQKEAGRREQEHL